MNLRLKSGSQGEKRGDASGMWDNNISETYDCQARNAENM